MKEKPSVQSFKHLSLRPSKRRSISHYHTVQLSYTRKKVQPKNQNAILKHCPKQNKRSRTPYCVTASSSRLHCSIPLMAEYFHFGASILACIIPFRLAFTINIKSSNHYDDDDDDDNDNDNEFLRNKPGVSRRISLTSLYWRHLAYKYCIVLYWRHLAYMLNGKLMMIAAGAGAAPPPLPLPSPVFWTSNRNMIYKNSSNLLRTALGSQ